MSNFVHNPVNYAGPHLHELKWLKACTTLSTIFSTCAKRQYFAVVLAPNKRVSGVGYNGSPPGMDHCTDGACPRLIEESESGTSYDNCISQHAEQGALLWSDPSTRQGGTLIVNGPPCMGCAKLIASSGIARVVHYEDPSYKAWNNVKMFLNAAGVFVVSVTHAPGPCQ
jgi:dCMP deaminase